MASRNPGDYLSLYSDASIGRIISPTETIIFSDIVIKINRKGKPQDRVLLVTNEAVYNLSEARKLKRRIALQIVSGITLSSISNQFVIHVPSEYDYRLSASRKLEAANVIVSAAAAIGRLIRLSETQQIDLSAVAKGNKAEARVRARTGSFAPQTPKSAVLTGAAGFDDVTLLSGLPGPAYRTQSESGDEDSEGDGRDLIRPLPVGGGGGGKHGMGQAASSSSSSSIAVGTGATSQYVGGPAASLRPAGAGAASSSSHQQTFGYSSPPPPPPPPPQGGNGHGCIGAQTAGPAAGWPVASGRQTSAGAGSSSAMYSGAVDQGYGQYQNNNSVVRSAGASAGRHTQQRQQQQLEYIDDDDYAAAGDGDGGAASASASQPDVRVTGWSRPDCPVGLHDFELLRVIGRGSYGKVLLVRKRDTGEVLAMKVLHKSVVVARNQVEHTQAERAILESIDHPFLVKLRYAFQTDSKLYLVLPYLRGGEVFYHLKVKKRFEEDLARHYAAEITLGLGHLHAVGIVYRDLKPENVLLDSEGHIRLTDFGLAKVLTQPDERASTFCGTPEYLAPEVIEGAPHDKGVDWWALGILLWEMLTGLPPFYNSNVQMMYEQIRAAHLHFPPSISPLAQSLLVELLARDPSNRLGNRAGDGDAEAVKAHPFFASIDWQGLFDRKVPPPWRPAVVGSADVSHFDRDFTSEPLADSVVSGSALASHMADHGTGAGGAGNSFAEPKFEGFTFVASGGMSGVLHAAGSPNLASL